MATLIFRTPDGIELGHRPMEASERYAFYEDWSAGTLVSFAGKRYKLHSVAWTRPAQECTLCVSFDSYEPVVDAE